MNAYLFSSIQSAAYGNLFECSTHEENGGDVVFSSMSHENEVGVMDDGGALLFASLLNTEGLKAKFLKVTFCRPKRWPRSWYPVMNSVERHGVGQVRDPPGEAGGGN